MEKSWMELGDRACHDYKVGVKNFIDFAWEKVSKDGKMICPCRKCNNARRDTKSEIEFHLVRYGIVRNYTTWYNHGERLTSKHNEVDEENEELVDHEINELLEDAFGMSNIADGMYDDLDEQNEEQEPTGEALKFYKLLEDSKQSLYPGCQTFSKLSFIITLLHIKCLSGWSNKSFTMLLKLLIKAFPLPNSFPASYRKAKSVVQDLGLDYQKIDACPNDCMLFRGIHENAENCITCGASRWKLGDTEKKRKVAMKTLRYFPLIPRLQRLFMCSKTAKQMTWHHWGRVNDGLMRHPADSEAWKELDRCHPQFAFDHRNVRLGLATDGFNPFGILSSTYSIWPVMLVVYNLPPWMCLKKPYTFLCLLIPGQKAPGNDIDVYLQPLLDELKFLWSSGVNTYDSSGT